MLTYYDIIIINYICIINICDEVRAGEYSPVVANNKQLSYCLTTCYDIGTHYVTLYL